MTMGRFGCSYGPFWTLLWAVLVVWWAVLDNAMGRFGQLFYKLKFWGRFGRGRFGDGPFCYRPSRSTAFSSLYSQQAGIRSTAFSSLYSQQAGIPSFQHQPWNHLPFHITSAQSLEVFIQHFLIATQTFLYDLITMFPFFSIPCGPRNNWHYFMTYICLLSLNTMSRVK